MAYNREIYEKALNIIKDKARENGVKYNALVARVYEQSPRLREIDYELGKIGCAAATTALAGDMVSLADIQKKSESLMAEKSDILKNAGVIKPEPMCRLCGDTGYIGNNYCTCVQAVAKRLTFEELSRSMPINNSKFENFDLNYYPDKPDKNGVVPKKIMTNVLKMAKEYTINFSPASRSLLFLGGVGLGKTHLSLAIVSEVIAKGYNAVYGSAQNLFSAVEREHFSYSGKSDKIDALLNADLLVIDDLGTEFSTSFTQSLFYDIINTRQLFSRPTIINTNLTLKELEDRYSPRITSRFIGSYELIKFFGRDIRQEKALQGK